VDIVEKKLAVLNLGVAITQVGFTRSQRFDFRAAEHDSGLEGLVDMVIVKRLFIFTDYFLSGWLLSTHGILYSKF
jgi:hypothetical protein